MNEVARNSGHGHGEKELEKDRDWERVERRQAEYIGRHYGIEVMNSERRANIEGCLNSEEDRAISKGTERGFRGEREDTLNHRGERRV